jgi:hypothetical protein
VNLSPCTSYHSSTFDKRTALLQWSGSLYTIVSIVDLSDIVCYHNNGKHIPLNTQYVLDVRCTPQSIQAARLGSRLNYSYRSSALVKIMTFNNLLPMS